MERGIMQANGRQFLNNHQLTFLYVYPYDRWRIILVRSRPYRIFKSSTTPSSTPTTGSPPMRTPYATLVLYKARRKKPLSWERDKIMWLATSFECNSSPKLYSFYKKHSIPRKVKEVAESLKKTMRLLDET